MSTKGLSATAFLVIAVCASSRASAGAKILTVSADGRGGAYPTVQAAVDAVPERNTEPVVIRIRPGTYQGKVTVPRNKPFVSFRGDDARTTILTNDWNSKHVGPDGRAVGTGGSASVRIEAADFVAEHVTFANAAGDTGQAVALAATGDRQVFRHCRVLGWQDTLYADGGRQYYDRCYVEGRVDFIFGGATAVFDRCELHSKDGGFVTAASTGRDKPWGYVFLDCKLTGDPTPWADPTGTQPARRASPTALLGRPWRPYASVIFVRCDMGDHIAPAGWDNWRDATNEKTARYAEYGSTGPGADPRTRVAWSRQLAKDEAEQITVEAVLGGTDGWRPMGNGEP